jgi:hypothetical protein
MSRQKPATTCTGHGAPPPPSNEIPTPLPYELVLYHPRTLEAITPLIPYIEYTAKDCMEPAQLEHILTRHPFVYTARTTKGPLLLEGHEFVLLALRHKIEKILVYEITEFKNRDCCSILQLLVAGPSLPGAPDRKAKTLIRMIQSELSAPYSHLFIKGTRTIEAARTIMPAQTAYKALM